MSEREKEWKNLPLCLYFYILFLKAKSNSGNVNLFIFLIIFLCFSIFEAKVERLLGLTVFYNSC